jgi:hypothetical protein
MSTHESDNQKLMVEIAAFLQQQREKAEEKSGDFSIVRPEWRELVRRQLDQSKKLNDFLRNLKEIPTEIVPRDQAVITDEGLATQALDVVGKSTGCEITKGNRTITQLSIGRTLGLSDEAIPDFLPTSYILLEKPASRIKFDPMDEPFGFDGNNVRMKLTIGSKIGALTDTQTKPIMENLISAFPEAPDITQFSHTTYYFFGNQVGKSVRLPEILLGKRIIEENKYYSYTEALSEITPKDRYLIKTSLKVIGKNFTS